MPAWWRNINFPEAKARSGNVFKSFAAKYRRRLSPLEADAGKMGQVDWGTAIARIDGVERTIHLFVLRLRHSGVVFARAYLHETMECFLEGHRKAFEWLDGVPRTLVPDNLKTAVLRILSGPDREETTLMSALRSHYLFESAFCRPGEGHEKVKVDKGIDFVQGNGLKGKEYSSLEALNRPLKAGDAPWPTPAFMEPPGPMRDKSSKGSSGRPCNLSLPIRSRF